VRGAERAGDPHLLGRVRRQFTFALLAFAICGNFAASTSNSLIWPNDQITRNAGSR